MSDETKPFRGRPVPIPAFVQAPTPDPRERGDDGPFFEDTEDAARKWLTDDRPLTAPETSRVCRALLDYSNRLRLQVLARDVGATHPAPAPSEAVAWQLVHTRTGQRWTPSEDRASVEIQQRALALDGVTETRIAALVDHHPAPARGVTGEMREAIMSAIEQAVASCVEQAGKRLPTEAWHVDYAGILDRVTDAMYTPDAEGGA